MVIYSTRVTPSQNDLIQAIREVRYGELQDVVLDDTDQPIINVEVSRQTKMLLDLIESGVGFFRVIRVHQGEPTLAEVPGETKVGHFKCIVQHRFFN